MYNVFIFKASPYLSRENIIIQQTNVIMFNEINDADINFKNIYFEQFFNILQTK